MRVLLVVVSAIAVGCAGRAPAPLPVPPPETGRVAIVARAASPAGRVRPIGVAVTNGGPAPLVVDGRQIYAVDENDALFAPLPPAEAARQAGGARLPGAVKGGAVGAVSGGALGAIGGAISGAIQGGLGAAVAVGTAVGATVGAIAGVLGGGSTASADVAGFTDRALPSTTLAPGQSATGYVYYPPGSYRALDFAFARDHPGGAARLRVPVEPQP